MRKDNASTSSELPEGFTPVFYYPDGKMATRRLGVSIEKTTGLVFVEPYPALPLKGHNKIWHVGWDIPTNWAIDARDQVWMDNAHGHALKPEKASVLLQSAQETYRGDIRKILCLPEEEPDWVKIARQKGWTPPAGQRGY